MTMSRALWWSDEGARFLTSEVPLQGSFHFAWVLDGHAEERQRGVTIDVGVTDFCTANRRVQARPYRPLSAPRGSLLRP